MNKYIYGLLLFFAIFICISGCANSTIPTTPSVILHGYPSTAEGIVVSAYPSSTADTVTMTAFESYPFALEAAQKWDPDSVLYAIPATGLMEMNIGYPPTGLGWFYTFKGKDPQLEYYVMVNDGVIIGTTEAQPIIVGERVDVYLPLPPLDEMVDSDKVLDIFLAGVGELYLSQNPSAIINPHLEYKASSNKFPTWIIFDISQGRTMEPIMYINALTGEIVE